MRPDLFETPEILPQNIQDILIEYGEIETYDQCQKLLNELNLHGYTFNYYLDAQPYNLRPMVSNKTKKLYKYLLENK